MEEKELDLFDTSNLHEYKAMETKLYGELMKSCRYYQNKLNLISILGILELISQEIKDLDKTNSSNDTEEEIIHNREFFDRTI